MAGREHIFQEAMNQGHSAAWDQQWERAAQFYRKALEEFPDHPKALSSLALALYETGQFEEALRYYQRAAKVSPQDPAPVAKMGTIYERMGKIKEAAQAFSHAGRLYLHSRDVDKAIESWTTALSLAPALLKTRFQLAQLYEKLGRREQAAREYLAAAALLQHAGRKSQALEILQRAQHAAPNSTEVRQAMSMLQHDRPLPLPKRKRDVAPALRKARVRQDVEEKADHGADPVVEARQKALSFLADLLFEQQAGESTAQPDRPNLLALTRGSGQLDQERIRQSQILLHIGRAIDLITREDYDPAITEVSQAISTGLDHPAAHFLLGYLQHRRGQLESAQRNLHRAVKHQDLGLAARLLRSKIALQQERWRDAAVESLEALKVADVSVAPEAIREELRQLYEPIIEERLQSDDPEAQRKLAENILELVLRPDWRKHLSEIRQQLTTTAEPSAIPLADMLTEARSSRVVDHMNIVMKLARIGHLRSAMEEAYYTLQFAPTYLPLHTVMGELLLKQERLQDALLKFKTVARTYNARGEAVQAIRLLKRVVQLTPLDMEAHQLLIRLLTDQGAVDEALSEYVDLAESFYRLAELDRARQTYEQALRLAKQSNANRAWSVQILHHMADIDMQRLNWRKALRVYDQIVTLDPNDEVARARLIELNYRMGNPPAAVKVLDDHLRHLQERGETEHAIEFVQRLLESLPDEATLLERLGRMYRLAGRREEAIEMLDKAGEMLLDAGDREGAKEIIRQIIQMNPPNADQYRQLLDTI